MKSKNSDFLDFKAPLTAEADSFLALAVAEFDNKQRVLHEVWRFNNFTNWKYEPKSGCLQLDFSDGARLIADGHLIGTYCVSQHSFEWAWNNPRFAPDISRESHRIKEAGQRLGITYLQAGLVPIKEEIFLSYLCAIAINITNSAGMFRGSEGDVRPLIAVENLRWA